MKKFYIIIMFLGFNTASFAGDSQDVNKMSADGKKTGAWKIYGNDKAYAGKGFAVDAVAEEGTFQDGKKVGIWKQYFPSGKTKSEIEYKNGRPGEYLKHITKMVRLKKREIGKTTVTPEDLNVIIKMVL